MGRRALSQTRPPGSHWVRKSGSWAARVHRLRRLARSKPTTKIKKLAGVARMSIGARLASVVAFWARALLGHAKWAAAIAGLPVTLADFDRDKVRETLSRF